MYFLSKLLQFKRCTLPLTPQNLSEMNPGIDTIL